MLDPSRYEALGLARVLDKVLAGERLAREDGLALFACPDPLAVGGLAAFRRRALHNDLVHYVINQHLNYTNVCVNGCAFCAYQREEGQAGGFVLTVEQALATVEKRLDQGLPEPVEVHIVGGCHPRLGLDYFTGLLSALRRRLPNTLLKCFTAVEIAHFAKLSGLTTGQVLAELKDAGLDMLPGGGAEIFDPQVRKRICPNKSTGREWLDIHGQAHALGISTNATMLFGHLETHAHRVDHLLALRERQDASAGLPGRFVCFIPLPFLTENSRLDVPEPLTGVEELKTVAVSRLMLDNIPHIKAYWVMLGVKQAQLALTFGADDLDGTVVEEKIGHEAGADSAQALTRTELEAMIRGAGFTPRERDSLFRPVIAGEATA